MSDVIKKNDLLAKDFGTQDLKTLKVENNI